MSSNLSVSPVQVQSNQGITGKDVGITAGAAALGALGGGAMYFKTPSEDAFVKAGLKLENKALAEQADTLTAALKTLSKDGGTLAEDAKTALTKLDVNDISVNGIKGKLTEVVGQISDQKVFDKATKAAKEAVKDADKFADNAFNLATADAAKTNLWTKLGLAGTDANAAKAIENAKKGVAENADEAAKKGVEILKKAKMSAALKWGGIAAGAAALLAAAYCFFTKGNEAPAEQAQTEQA